MGAFLVIQRQARRQRHPAARSWSGINLVIGFLPGLNIAWQAHVGGLIGGAVIGLIYVQTRQRSKRTQQFVLLGGFAALLVALSLTQVLRLGPPALRLHRVIHTRWRKLSTGVSTLGIITRL